MRPLLSRCFTPSMATLSFFSPSLLPCPRMIPFRSLPPTSTTLRGWIMPWRGIVRARAANDSPESASTSLSVVKSVKSAWASPEERIGLTGLGIASIIVLWAAINTVTAIDKVPLLPSVFEFIGILFSWWFLYRFLLFKPNRKELVEIIEGSISVVLGQ